MQQAAQPQLASPPDFDFQMPCRYFKSSFARSLSLNGGGSAALALPKNKKPQTNEVMQPQRQLQRQNKEEPIEIEMETEEEREGEEESSCCSTPPPALPARRHTSGHNNNLMHFSSAAANQLLLSPLPALVQMQTTQTQRNLNHVWPMQQPQASQSTSQQDSSSNSHIMTMRAAAPSCHSQSYHNHYDLQPQQQHHQQQPLQPSQQQQQQQKHPLNVEAVILQNQVDTLHWQLKQTETNCEMYRAVMEEVARFFERYQQQLLLQQTHRNGEQIARSKSLHHVHGVGHGSSGSIGSSLQSEQRDGLLLHDEDDVSASYLRARSSTNLMLNKSMHAMNEEHNYEAIAPAGSYNAFKDFTWRRSPKKTGGCKARLSAPEVAEEKLNQEAFRLARTIRNLLNTSEQQPDLTQPRHSMASVSSLASNGNGNGNGSHMPHLHRLCKAKTSSVMTLLQTPPRHNSTSIMNATMEAPSPAPSATTVGKSHAEMLFLRANTMRDSRLSLRSSTDSSVHSTISSTASSASSKIETDDDANNNNTKNSSNNNLTTTTASSTAATATAISHNKKTQPTNAVGGGGGSSSTEDESGFSSISSFHDVGLPLSSTLVGGGGINHQRRLSVSTTDSRNSTLKSGALNVLGVPLQQTQTLSQNSQQSSPQPSKTTYRNAGRYQRFSTLSNEDAAAVLWV
ncbi:putative mediator of RNA polymerase II transcription subunit 26 isoform X1 [Drosophila subobscura]|uniref:putative mediator of RNA polymerase II transcription subunit 26 isoform X1 n=1 Tax=Drosophila subobscura TaxID=7241 RepID=UPI00155A67EC|nr:putative mediator of RNA polymerase II transcription subunit 26 isoform X1 [Drosophila subobscura]XP_034656907.1 putative mediator of RNA polymerase II transcription subunit 26 isoform X1 [Drosophila subobscura]